MNRRFPIPVIHCVRALISAIVLGTFCFAAFAADYVPAAPIAIRSDLEFTSENGVLTGCGTSGDPFVIADLEIDASGSPYGILVENTMAVFRIENCRIFGAASTALRLTATQSASVVQCKMESSETGIELLEATCTRLTENEISDCTHAVLLQLASANVIEDNVAIGGLLGVGLESWSEDNVVRDNVFDCIVALAVGQDCNRNVFYRNDFLSTWVSCDAYCQWVNSQQEGNYWAGYRGQDVDGDGIGDTAFAIAGFGRQQDLRPATAPFHPEEPE